MSKEKLVSKEETKLIPGKGRYQQSLTYLYIRAHL